MTNKFNFSAFFFMLIIVTSYGWSNTEMQLIPETSFSRSDNSGNIQNVTLSAFYIAYAPVTIQEWGNYLKKNNKPTEQWKNQVLKSLDDYSIKNIDPLWPAWYFSWIEAIQYCNWLSKTEGFTPCYIITTDEKKEWKVEWKREANGFRLPTVAEWQLTSEIFSDKLTIDKILSQNVLYENNKKKLPAKVKSLSPNTFGLFDMMGNIQIFCWDYYNPNEAWERSTTNPIGPSTFQPDEDEVYYNELLHETRVIAGGMWTSKIQYLRKNPLEYTVSVSTGYVGMRLVRNNH
jgi:formylglycine-generating enzyme